MLTRSKCMAASGAASEKKWERERVSDTFHPPTTVVAVPDPTLAQSEPPPNPANNNNNSDNSLSDATRT